MSVLIVFTAASTNLQPAKAAELDCGVVKEAATVIYHPEDQLSIGKTEDGDTHTCLFSINGAAINPAPQTTSAIHEALVALRFLLRFSRGQLDQREMDEFGDYMRQLLENLGSLWAAPKLDDGLPPTELIERVNGNKSLIESCVTDFFRLSKEPAYTSKDIECSGKSDIIYLRTMLSHSDQYHLLFFR